MKKPYFKSHDGQEFFLEHVYIDYDGPVFFLCSDEFDSKYMGAASVETKEYSSWTLVKISTSRLMQVQENKITLYDLFKLAETGKILYIQGYMGQDFDVFKEISTSQLPDNILPAQGAFLELSQNELYDYSITVQENDVSFLEQAQVSLTPHCDIEIAFPACQDQHFIRAGVAGELLTVFDNLRLALQLEKGLPPGRSSVKRVTDEGFDLYDIEAASFVFKLRAQRGSLIENKATASLVALVELLKFSDRTTEFEVFLSNHNKAIVGLYKKLASILIQSKFEIGVRIALPHSNQVNTIFLDNKDLVKRKLMLDEINDELRESVEKHGLLSGFEPMKKAVFSFIADDEVDYISGKIEQVYLDQIHSGNEKYDFPAYGTIGLTKITKYSIASDTEKVYYVMSSFLKD